MRKVIFHYHLFKNAGTSLDAAFKENFKGDEWVTREFSGNPAKNREEVAQWILDNPQAKVFSSHTAYLPPPELDGIKVLPVIFFRHPIDRIASAYSFEKKQGGDSFGAVLARNTDLSGYIETRLAIPNDRQCRNFHMQRFAMMYNENFGDEFYRAGKAIEALPFVGIVDEFSESVSKLEYWLSSEGFEDIHLNPLEKNVSREVKRPLDEKIKDFEGRISTAVFNKLNAENELDLQLYNVLKKNVK